MGPIIEVLFGTVTVLGFLALFTFCVTKTGFFEVLSIRSFWEEREEEPIELFELVLCATNAEIGQEQGPA